MSLPCVVPLRRSGERLAGGVSSKRSADAAGAPEEVRKAGARQSGSPERKLWVKSRRHSTKPRRGGRRLCRPCGAGGVEGVDIPGLSPWATILPPYGLEVGRACSFRLLHTRWGPTSGPAAGAGRGPGGRQSGSRVPGATVALSAAVPPDFPGGSIPGRPRTWQAGIRKRRLESRNLPIRQDGAQKATTTAPRTGRTSQTTAPMGPDCGPNGAGLSGAPSWGPAAP